MRAVPSDVWIRCDQYTGRGTSPFADPPFAHTYYHKKEQSLQSACYRSHALFLIGHQRFSQVCVAVEFSGWHTGLPSHPSIMHYRNEVQADLTPDSCLSFGRECGWLEP